jgi:sugar lactone lactonase YvrE
LINKLEHILSINNITGEGPIWNIDEQTLYWVDVLKHRIYRLAPRTGKSEFFDIGISISAIAFRKSGGLLLATKDGLAFWNDHSDKLQFIVDHCKFKTNAPLNDGAVDRQGRFWVGTWSGDSSNLPANNLYRLDPDETLKVMETGIHLSNGIGWSPDNKFMYYTDSSIHIIYKYDFDLSSGEIENKRIFIKTPDDEGEPDGLKVDSEGFVWSARWDGWKISRYDPMGKIEREFQLPVQRPTSICFGGKDLCDLYITSAQFGLSKKEKERQPFAGNLFKIRTDIKGLEESKFLG